MRLIDADALKKDDELTEWLTRDTIRTGKMLKAFSELFVKKIDDAPTVNAVSEEIYTREYNLRKNAEFKVYKLEKALEQKQNPKTIQEIQAESEKYQKAFEDGYGQGYAQARFDYEQETYNDAISRQDALDCIKANGLKKFDFILDARAKIKNLPSVTPQEPFGDDISRHDVECIVEELENICHNAPQEVLELLAKLKNAPFATPYPKTGHWVEENVNGGCRRVFCSECGCPPPFEHISTGDVYSASGYGVINKTKFCPNCGVKMESESDV